MSNILSPNFKLLRKNQHMDETFHWYCYDSFVEDIARYRPGGYHPMKLGDYFSTLNSANLSSSTLPRYRYRR